LIDKRPNKDLVDDSVNGADRSKSVENDSSQDAQAFQLDARQSTQTSENREPDGIPDVDIESLIAAHHVTVYRYAYRLTGNASDAEDLTQQTFLLAHQQLHQLRESSKALSWLLTIVRNSFFKMIRRQRPNCAANLELDVDQIEQPQLKQLTIDTEKIQLAMNRLDEQQRVMLTMFYFEQLSYKQIADQLKIKIGTVMSRLSRAKAKLRGTLMMAGFDGFENGTEPNGIHDQ
jgi:RNA polymerase sigma-70 factor (ECF subfamily)